VRGEDAVAQKVNTVLGTHDLARHPGGRVARLQPHAACGDGRHAAGVGPEGTAQGLSKKFPRAEEAPAETRRDHQVVTCLDRQTPQESKSQCSDTLTGLEYGS